MYRIVYDKQAVKDIKNLKSARLDDKAKKLIEVIRETPFQNPPPYEALVGNLQGVYSRRINIQHRLVYQVYSEPVEWKGMRYDGTVKIIRMWTHYDGVWLYFYANRKAESYRDALRFSFFYGRVE